MSTRFPVIDPVATGENIVRLRSERGLSVRDLQEYFGFEEPRAIYKWQRGQTLPSVDNLFALGAILQVPMDEIIVSTEPQLHILATERQAEACRSALFIGCFRYDRRPRTHPPFSPLNRSRRLPRMAAALPIQQKVTDHQRCIRSLEKCTISSRIFQ